MLKMNKQSNYNQMGKQIQVLLATLKKKIFLKSLNVALKRESV